MAAVTSLTVSVEGCEDAAASARSVADVLDRFPGRFGKTLMALDEAGDLVRVETPDIAAAGARVLHTLKVQPTDRYVETLAAIANEADDCSVNFLHGWPILSLGASNTPSVTGTGGAGNGASGEGAA